ncbi:MAG TPA: hypothetical protein VH092_35575 [Urbifossiella sp.]|nr:hypothetical protein [Urbifossiella sp.]
MKAEIGLAAALDAVVAKMQVASPDAPRDVDPERYCRLKRLG